jgi:hypothetical protein
MAVVNHHRGSPNRSTTVQNDKTTSERVRTFSGVSGGGSLPDMVYKVVDVVQVLMQDN